MDISKEKIASLLGNPQVMSMISGLASGLSLSSTEPSAEDLVNQEQIPDADTQISENVPADIEVLPKPALVNMPHDRRIALLEAIKPYVSTSKRTKVDGLVKAIGVAGILNTYTSAFFTSPSDNGESDRE